MSEMKHPGAAQWLPWVRAIRAEDVPALVRAAEADNHVVLAPTHLVVRGGEILGYASVGAVPLVLTWLDSKKVKARDMMYLVNLAENMVGTAGQAQAGVVCVPCAEDSPIYPHMGALGYEQYGRVMFNLKRVA